MAEGIAKKIEGLGNAIGDLGGVMRGYTELYKVMEEGRQRREEELKIANDQLTIWKQDGILPLEILVEKPGERTPGWLYVPHIDTEFSPDLYGVGLGRYNCLRLAQSVGCFMPSLAETWALFFHSKEKLDEPEFNKFYNFFTQPVQDRDQYHAEYQNAIAFLEKGELQFRRIKAVLPSEFEREYPNYYFGRRRAVYEDILKGIRFVSPGEVFLVEPNKKEDVKGIILVDVSEKKNIASGGLPKIKSNLDTYNPGENLFFQIPSKAKYNSRGDTEELHGAVFYVGQEGACLDFGEYRGAGVRLARQVGKPRHLL